MGDNVISYIEMCRRESASLQQGMNFGIGGNHSVILMSVRRNAPYQDRLEDGGTTLVYEGHDQPRGLKHPNPKVVDQPERFPSGQLTQNGKFHEAAQLYKSGRHPAERVRVYEKIQPGIWSYNGVFHLIDSWRERDKYREVFKALAVHHGEHSAAPSHTDIGKAGSMEKRCGKVCHMRCNR